MKLRNEKGPEEKYNFMLQTSWEYGRNFDELVDLTSVNKTHYHRNIFKNTNYRSQGIPMKSLDDILQKKRFNI